MPELLLEKNRRELIDQSKNADIVKSYGTTRYERRSKQHIYNSITNFNKIDMNALFKGNLLSFKIPVHGETDNYEVEVLFEGICDDIKREIKRNKDKFEYKCVYRALINAINKQDIYIACSCPDWCLDGNTKIKLLNNEVYTIEELKNKFDSGEDFWVYSIDSSGNIKPGHVDDVWVSGHTTELTKVTLYNGEEILTTPNHRYMLEDGSYLEAEKLQAGQPLMSLPQKLVEKNIAVIEENSKVKSVEFIKYENSIPVYDLSVDEWNNFYVNAGVILHNCYRFSYWATKDKYNGGRPEVRVANITNPGNTKGAGCKHTIQVLYNLDWAMKLATSITNYVEYMKENYEDKFARLIFPALYDMSYDQAVQMNLFGTDDELANPVDNEEDIEDIDRAIERSLASKK